MSSLWNGTQRLGGLGLEAQGALASPPESRNFILPEDEDEKRSCAETCAGGQPAFSRRNVGGRCGSGAMPEYVFPACLW